MWRLSESVMVDCFWSLPTIRATLAWQASGRPSMSGTVAAVSSSVDSMYKHMERRPSTRCFFTPPTSSFLPTASIPRHRHPKLSLYRIFALFCTCFCLYLLLNEFWFKIKIGAKIKLRAKNCVQSYDGTTCVVWQHLFDVDLNFLTYPASLFLVYFYP